MAQGTHFPDWLVRRDPYLAEMLAHDTVLFEYFEERRRSQPRWRLIDRNAGWEFKIMIWALVLWVVHWTEILAGSWLMSSSAGAIVGGYVVGFALHFITARPWMLRGGGLPHRFLYLFPDDWSRAPALLDMWQAGVKGSDLVRTAYLSQCVMRRSAMALAVVMCVAPSLVCWLLLGAAPWTALSMSVALMVMYAVMYRRVLAVGLGVSGGMQVALHLCQRVDLRSYRAYAMEGLLSVGLPIAIGIATMIYHLGRGGIHTESIMLAVTMSLLMGALALAVMHRWLVRRAQTRFEELYARSDEMFEEFVHRFILMEEAAASEPASASST